MPNRIESILTKHKTEGTKALMPFFVAGRPAPGALPALLKSTHAAGASIAEIGIPFSDPIADGPVIAGSMHQALQAGVTPESALDEIRVARQNHDLDNLGLVAMVSMSIVYRFGPADFSRRCADAGCDGLIVPDVPLEEARQIAPHAADSGLTCTFLIAPTTPLDRAQRIAQQCTGFVYVLARAGITGEQSGGPSEHLALRVAALRQATDLPIAVGFGIASGDSVRQVVHDAGADAAIVGSALVRRIDEAGPGDPAIAATSEFTTELATGL